MAMTTRNPTMVADCGCPYDPEYDEESLGWHLAENHVAEAIDHLRLSLLQACELLKREAGAGVTRFLQTARRRNPRPAISLPDDGGGQ